ncbi:MAG: hypothetical protein ACRCXM_08725 [Beijerinckiaceae bacterium]
MGRLATLSPGVKHSSRRDLFAADLFAASVGPHPACGSGFDERGQTGYAALKIIADERFCAWRGKSGKRYVTSIYSFADCPDYEHVVALAVRRDWDGARTVIDGLDLGPFPLVSLGGDILEQARVRGATEIHLHLLADTAEARQAVLDDLI